MKRVAFLAYGIGDISGGGGYERFFTDFFADYQSDDQRNYDLLLITDNKDAFIKMDNLRKFENSVIQYNDYRFKLYYDLTDKLFLLKQFFKFWRTLCTQWAFLKLLRKNKIEILHLPNYTESYFYLISFVSKMRFFTGIKTAVTIVDCRIPFKYDSHEGYFVKAGATAHTFKPLFSKVKLNGIFTWYRSFKDFVVKNKLVPDTTVIYPIESRYVNYNDGILPFAEKKNKMIFAGRLDEQKRPLIFLNAIRIANERDPSLLKDWKFEIYGKGVLLESCKKYIDENTLSKLVELSFSPNMKKVFRESKCLVSVQEYENFPSLSVYEAMVTGNAIIAFNVGQTSSFIRHGENGLLIEQETAEALATGILNYISDSALHEIYYKNNLRLCSESHTYRNFKRQIEEFWGRL